MYVIASACLNPRFQDSGGHEAEPPASQEKKANKGMTEGASGGKRKRREETNENPRFQDSGGHEAEPPSSQEKKANKGKEGASEGKRKRREETNEDDDDDVEDMAAKEIKPKHGGALQKDIKPYDHKFLWSRCVPKAHCHLTVCTYTLAYIHTYIHTYICIYTKS